MLCNMNMWRVSLRSPNSLIRRAEGLRARLLVLFVAFDSDIMISVNFQLNYQWASVHSNSCSSNGLKSRPESCPYSPVAQGNGVLVTEGREFPIGKTAGRNEREPISSLVKIREDADPVDVRGRPKPDRLENGSVCQDLPG